MLGEAYGVLVIPGMELTTEEEAHVVCLFPALENALAFSDYVYERLLPIKNKPEVFGHQYICDEDENIKGENNANETHYNMRIKNEISDII